MQLKGIYCPVITPFVDTKPANDKLEENLEKLSVTGLKGFVLLGSSGETPFLSHDEKIELIKTARNQVSGDKLLIVGTGLESTPATIEFTKQVADFGADYALVLTPNYYKPQMIEANFKEHYTSVADSSPVPIILYNVPSFTGIDIPAAVVNELSEHPNIIGIKDSTSSLAKIAQIITESAKNFSIFIGNAALYFSGLVTGAEGAVLALCNIAPQVCVEIYKLFKKEDFERAREQYFRIFPLAQRILQPYGIPAIKTAMDMLGYYGGPPRKPLLPLSDKIISEIQSYLKRAELL